MRKSLILILLIFSIFAIIAPRFPANSTLAFGAVEDDDTPAGPPPGTDTGSGSDSGTPQSPPGTDTGSGSDSGTPQSPPGGGVEDDDTPAGPPPGTDTGSGSGSGTPQSPPGGGVEDDDTPAGPPPGTDTGSDSDSDSGSGTPQSPPGGGVEDDDTPAGPPPGTDTGSGSGSGTPQSPPGGGVEDDDTPAGPPPGTDTGSGSGSGTPQSPPSSSPGDQGPLPPGHIRICEQVVTPSGIQTICQEGLDSDGDGNIDLPILDHEICNDGIDNNANGNTDEGCPQDLPTGNDIQNDSPAIEICNDHTDNDHDGSIDEGCIGTNSGLSGQAAPFDAGTGSCLGCLNPSTGVCFGCEEDNANAGPRPQGSNLPQLENTKSNIEGADLIPMSNSAVDKALAPFDLLTAEAQPLHYINAGSNGSTEKQVLFQNSKSNLQLTSSQGERIDHMYDTPKLNQNFSGTTKLYNSSLNAEELYRTRNLYLDADVKNVVIAIPQNIHTNNIDVGRFDVTPIRIIIVQGTMVTWLNSDPSLLHNIVVKSDGTGKEMYVSSQIQYSESSNLKFLDKGTYTYFDPNYSNIKGIIQVVGREQAIDNELTDSNTKIVGLLLSDYTQMQQYDHFFSTRGHHLVSSYVIQNVGTTSNSNELAEVLYIWTSNVPGI